ncbi:Histidine phosphatase superfamily [Macleaya cordata]|uniref:Histidine phosphatase superfamily n=1 Tax=Macleaya cordata TaxID=56857 RepID=A0A200RAF2_MACCD|nr:Histidine phosphatase superfamily [Macleaya cordata]
MMMMTMKATTLCNSSVFSNTFPCSSSSSSSSALCPNFSLSLRLRNLNLSTTTTAAPPQSSLVVIDETSTTNEGDLAAASASAEEESSSKSAARRLILLRHAESSWENRSVRDHDRPLSKAGRSDAVNVSSKLQQLGWVPELILSSDAARTQETLKIMQEQVQGFLEAEVHFISSFYSIAAMDGQTAEHLQQAICEYSRDEMLTVMCMGHNRGWEEAASMLSGTAIELKTCNAALLEATGKSWDEAFALAGLGGWKLHGIVKPN